MTTDVPSVPESCTQCPHIDQFHSTCSHPNRQAIVQELRKDADVCPLFSDVRSDAMRALEDQLDSDSDGE